MKSLQRRNRFPCFLSLCLALILLSMPAQGAVGYDDSPLNVGDVLLGPCGVPGALGPEGTNDDFTNRSISTGIANTGPVTTAPIAIVFRNTLQNTGAGDDSFVLSAPATTAGFVIEMSIDNGDHYITLETSHPSITVAVAYRAATIVLVRINAPAGVSSAAGVGNSLLTAHNLVISENGNSASNNWGATTEHVVGASDTQGGVIVGDRAGSTWLTDIVTTLEAGQTGVFKFKRKVK